MSLSSIANLYTLEILKQMNALLVHFIWAHKRPRLQRWLSTLPKYHGGTAVPDVHKYYQAAHMGRLIDWCRHVELELWPQIDQSQSTVPLRCAAWCFADLSPNLKTHPTLGPTLSICSWICSTTSLSVHSPPLPYCGESSLLSWTARGSISCTFRLAMLPRLAFSGIHTLALIISIDFSEQPLSSRLLECLTAPTLFELPSTSRQFPTTVDPL